MTNWKMHDQLFPIFPARLGKGVEVGGTPIRKKGNTLMRFLNRVSTRNMLFAAAFGGVFAFASLSSFAQDDPPDQAGRISMAAGTVSIQTAGSDDWGQAYPNLPIGPGDRIFTDQDGRVEIQVGQSYLRIGPNTDVTLVDDDENEVSFGVAQGSVHVRSFGLWQGQSLDLSTPNGDARLEQAGEFRVDSLPDQGASIFTSLGSNLFVSGAGNFGQPLTNWQSLELAGTNPVYPQWLQANGPDNLDAWSQQRDQQIINSASYRYVSPEVGGAAELDANGDWIPDSDYGPIWFPHNVQADWEPYHNGHWINRDPWGWVWVEDEPWGYAPFHYGRWVSYRGRWGWVPGPREQHPVWSPALVVFAGGIQVGGVGVSAWFPLGPGEAYRPWYKCSPRYVDRVNISNIRESRVVHVQTTYVNIVNVTNVTNITYVNRNIGASAMRQEDFAAGRGVQRASVAVDRRQFDHVQVVDRPAPVTRQSVITRPTAHPVPVTVARPVFINQKGMQISARPGARPQPPPVRPMETMKTLPGRTVVAPPQGSRFQPQPNPAGRPVAPNNGQQQGYPNQQPANHPAGQPVGGQPPAPGAQPVGRPLPPPNGQHEGNPNPPPNNQYGQPGQQPQAPGVRPNGRPMPPPNGQHEGNPNPPPNNQYGQPGQQPQAPGAQPNGRPIPPPNGQHEGNPNPPPNNQYGQPGQQPQAPGVRPNGRPVPPPNEGNPNQNRPSPPPAAPPQQAPPAARPAPPPTYRQPSPPNQPPANNQPQGRPALPPQPQPSGRPAAPPPPAGRQAAPAEPNRQDTQKQNKGDKKDEKKNEKQDHN